MNFDTEKPVVLRFVDLMIRAEERRERDAATAPGYACSGPGGRMLYVNGIPREQKYCPRCLPLRRQPHRCKLAVGGVDPERYWRVRAQMIARGKEIIRMKKLSEIARIRVGYAETNPYRGGSTPLSGYRSSWKKEVSIEYYVANGAAHLNVRGDGRSPTPDEVREVRNAFAVPVAATEIPEAREDGTYIVRMEWQTAKQAAMVLA